MFSTLSSLPGYEIFSLVTKIIFSEGVAPSASSLIFGLGRKMDFSVVGEEQSGYFSYFLTPIIILHFHTEAYQYILL